MNKRAGNCRNEKTVETIKWGIDSIDDSRDDVRSMGGKTNTDTLETNPK